MTHAWLNSHLLDTHGHSRILLDTLGYLLNSHLLDTHGYSSGLWYPPACIYKPSPLTHTSCQGEQRWPARRQKHPQLCHQSEFLHNYYTDVSMHDGDHNSDHNGIVKTFCASSLSVEIFRSNFSPTRYNNEPWNHSSAMQCTSNNIAEMSVYCWCHSNRNLEF